MRLHLSKSWPQVGIRILMLSILCTSCDPESNASQLGLEDVLNGIHVPELGTGVDFSETRTFRRCVTGPKTTTRHAAPKRLYEEIAVSDKADINKALNIDASLSAKGLWGSATEFATYFNQVQMSSDAFYWLVHADYSVQDEALATDFSDLKLTDEAKEILSGPRGLSGFYEACGHSFVSGSRLGARHALLYEFRRVRFF